MYLTTVKLAEAVGQILLHNVPDTNGRKAFAKGHRLVADDVPRLHDLGVEILEIAVLEHHDVHEDEAARRVAAAIAGTHLIATSPAGGRVNLLADSDGLVTINTDALYAINMIDGLAVATVTTYTRALPKQRVATVKVIPFALHTDLVQEAETVIRRCGMAISVRQLPQRAIGIVLVGSSTSLPRIEQALLPGIVSRIQDVGSTVLRVEGVEADRSAIARALKRLQHDGAHMLIIAGETSVMDRDDVTPRAVLEAGGLIEHFGAPVEPGNLLLLAYFYAHDGIRIPVLGAPGCVRSRTRNVVDLILPRLLIGEHLTRHDIVSLGHGGLLG